MKGRVMWTCGSMNPGNTYLPAASTTCVPAGASRPAPNLVMVSPPQKKSALASASAVMISPFLIRRGMGGSFPPDVVHGAAKPAGCDNLLPRVELHGLAPLDVEVAVERGVPAGEREHRHRGGHADVDPDHPGLDPVFEPAGRSPLRCED